MDSKPSRNLTVELARALGLPKNTTKAVLTLEAGKLPRLELTMHCVDGSGLLVVEPNPQMGGAAQRIASVQFMVRLEHFPEAP